ncbi:MAG TPA: rhodanese-like domain-containing protein [Candidatus Ozemobacteraceae bacterium]|nr:rhodanese-like domain-containing protein [Candidatus Ozemobacteraceae bacterium]
MQSFSLWRRLVLIVALCWSLALHAGTIKDTESASHDDTAAKYDLVATYDGGAYRILQYNLAVLSHYSYALISGKEALIVDPGRDIDTYLELLKKEGLTCRGVFLTHSHADFVAGHTELAKALGCKMYASHVSGAEYPFEPLRDGTTLEVGDALLSFLETPGHTPDGICALVAAKSSPKEPKHLFTGDTLFVGSVGRPDLMGGTTSASALAGMLFDTWTNKLSKLPDSVSIFPAHGAGSLCGAHLSDEPTSTLGAQKQVNSYLQYAGSRSAFIAAVLDGLPEAPQYFKHNAQMNRKGPALVDWAATPEVVAPQAALTDVSRGYVVDVRDAKTYADGHIPNSVNIGVRGRLETWVGIMVPWGSNLILCGSPAETAESVRRLHRVGYTAKTIDWTAWKTAGLPVARNQMTTPEALYQGMQKGDAPLIVDVRLPTEWMGLRIGQVLNLPLNHLGETAPVKLEKEQPVVAVCNSAYRSSMAVGVLERLGFSKASSLEGGSEAWIAAGYPVFGATAAGSHATPAPTQLRSVNLPDRLAPADLRRLKLDLPGTFEIIDLRPAAAIADYNPLQARPVDVAAALSDPSLLVGDIPLIITDRDGSLAMMIAGILSQKTKRPIKALHGGMESWWTDNEKQRLLTPSSTGTTAPTGVAPRISPPIVAPITTPAAPSSPAPAQPAPKKKKSAGC